MTGYNQRKMGFPGLGLGLWPAFLPGANKGSSYAESPLHRTGTDEDLSSFGGSSDVEVPQQYAKSLEACLATADRMLFSQQSSKVDSNDSKALPSHLAPVLTNSDTVFPETSPGNLTYEPVFWHDQPTDESSHDPMRNWYVDDNGPWNSFSKIPAESITEDQQLQKSSLTGLHPAEPPGDTCFTRRAVIPGAAMRGPYIRCRPCGNDKGSTHYHCSTCPNDGYTVCLSCAEKGLSCPSTDHMLMKRIYNEKKRVFEDDKLHTISRGLPVLINGQIIPGIGDTGSEETIVSSKRCYEMGWLIKPSRKTMRLGNQGIMTSVGTVRISVSFPDRPKEAVQVVARVVTSFCFDILLGRPFLKATQTMEKYIHRFKRCLFPARNLWAFYRIGETAQRFNATMGKGTPFAALPDTGSRRNVMNAEWAIQQGFDIRTERENLGWITFPAGPDEATVGQVHTWISLPAGKLVPIVFDLLPTCRLPVVLGIDFVLDNNIYQEYADLFSDAERNMEEKASECMGMGYKPWYATSVNKLVQKAKNLRKRASSSYSNTSTNGVSSQRDLSLKSMMPSPAHSGLTSETQELKRQREWDGRYGGGKLATVKEWNEEMQRRRIHEGPNRSDTANTLSLIAHSPTAAEQSENLFSREAHGSILRLSPLDGSISIYDMQETGMEDRQGKTMHGQGVEVTSDIERSAQATGGATLFGELEAVHWRT